MIEIGGTALSSFRIKKGEKQGKTSVCCRERRTRAESVSNLMGLTGP
jgi:hypothetical protein